MKPLSSLIGDRGPEHVDALQFTQSGQMHQTGVGNRPTQLQMCQLGQVFQMSQTVVADVSLLEVQHTQTRQSRQVDQPVVGHRCVLEVQSLQLCEIRHVPECRVGNSVVIAQIQPFQTGQRTDVPQLRIRNGIRQIQSAQSFEMLQSQQHLIGNRALGKGHLVHLAPVIRLQAGSEFRQLGRNR